MLVCHPELPSSGAEKSVPCLFDGSQRFQMALYLGSCFVRAEIENWMDDRLINTVSVCSDLI